MSKKARSGQKGTQRGKPKIQKRVELVRPKSSFSGGERQKGNGTGDKQLEVANTDTTIVMTGPGEAQDYRRATRKGSAYAHGALRRPIQNTSALITPEDSKYIKRDLIRIGILSSIMITALVVLTFILGVD